MALTTKNKLFLEEYVANGYNATQAYWTIYKCEYETANSKAPVVLKKPEAKEYIKELQKERTERLNISADRVLEELAKVAFTEDERKTTNKLRALELIQKQIGAQAPQKIEADVNQQVVFIDDTDTVE